MKPTTTEQSEERVRLEKQILVALHHQLLCEDATKAATADGLAKAKEEVVRKERDKAQQYEEKLRALHANMARIEELKAGRL